MKRLLYIVAFFFVASACSSDTSIAELDNEETTNEVVVVVPNRLLTMEIDGMVCEMGCGGSIRKELKGTGGVSSVEFNFEEERATNIAKVSFDKNLVTVDEIIKAVSEMQDGQFEVGETSSETLDVMPTTEESSSSSSESSKVDVSTKHVEMPNLLDLLSGLLIQ